uniref:Uncharacterized protein n=1 Tax=Setaria viridis TaxID=4556 RepID=A0A4U6TQN0_SETVI|nr:hypothetical protein SEVIR_7G015400v2 [Setaria viridis]
MMTRGPPLCPVSSRPRPRWPRQAHCPQLHRRPAHYATEDRPLPHRCCLTSRAHLPHPDSRPRAPTPSSPPVTPQSRCPRVHLATLPPPLTAAQAVTPPFPRLTSSVPQQSRSSCTHSRRAARPVASPATPSPTILPSHTHYLLYFSPPLSPPHLELPLLPASRSDSFALASPWSPGARRTIRRARRPAQGASEGPYLAGSPPPEAYRLPPFLLGLFLPDPETSSVGPEVSCRPLSRSSRS